MFAEGSSLVSGKLVSAEQNFVSMEVTPSVEKVDFSCREREEKISVEESKGCQGEFLRVERGKTYVFGIVAGGWPNRLCDHSQPTPPQT